MIPRALMRVCAGAALLVGACVPPGNSTPSDAGASTNAAASAAAVKQAVTVMTTAFEDSFDRTAGSTAPIATTPLLFPGLVAEAGSRDAATSDAGFVDGATEAGASADPEAGASTLGPEWYQAQTNVWHLENGKLCGQGAKNHGVWLKRTLPINARIEFDAWSDSPEGDLKAEFWGDGQSSATSLSYTNATSYLTVLGGWKNTIHVLARLNEHGSDRKEIKVDKDSDDPRQKPVTRGQLYHFKVERTDGKSVRWFVDGLEYLTYTDAAPLAGIGHDHFGFNDWEVKVCFDNVHVTPL